MHQNPFSSLPLPPELPLAGGPEIVDWLLKGIQQGARLLLYGARGIGKTSQLAWAADQLRKRDLGVMIRIDVSAHPTMSGVITQLHQAAAGLAPGLPLQNPAEGYKDPGVGADRAAPNAEFFAALAQLNRAAGSMDQPTVLVFDNFTDLRRLGGALVEQGLRNALQSHRSLGYVFAANEQPIAALLADPSHPLFNQLQAKAVDPIDPRQLASWIDERFAQANFVSAGAGAACVTQGGPRTSDIIDLAHRTFALATEPRFANAATVDQAFAQAMNEKRDRFTKIWDGLGAPERSALKTVAEGNGESLLSASASPAGATKSSTKHAVNTLLDRGLIEKVGSAGLAVESPAFRGWSLQAKLTVTRDRGTATARPSMRFAFDLHAGTTAERKTSLTP